MALPTSSTPPWQELLRSINAAAFELNEPRWRQLSAEALDLVGQLLQRDPLDRPYLEEVMQHPFCSAAVQEAMASEQGVGLASEALDDALAELDGDEEDIS